VSVGLWLFLIIATTLTDGSDSWRMPVADDGAECPMPLDPLRIFGHPLGMYHCPYCGSMVMASWPHTDYTALSNPTEETN
jgi:hypothetical protein